MSKRRKIIISSEHEKLLEDFYNQLDDDTFLDNSFEDEDNLPVVVIAPELSPDDDDDDDDDDDVIDELELDDADKVVEEPHIPVFHGSKGLLILMRLQITKILTQFPLKNMQPFGILIRTNCM